MILHLKLCIENFVFLYGLVGNYIFSVTFSYTYSSPHDGINIFSFQNVKNMLQNVFNIWARNIRLYSGV